MTEKIFYKSLYQTEFDAEVLEVVDGRGLVLDRTLFYPGGGGQPCDLGFINGLEVVNVYEHDGAIVHELKDLNIKFELTDRAKESIIENGFDPNFGARPLKRYVQRIIETKGSCIA